MPELPQITISDSEFEKSGWQPSQGWSGMVPGVTTFEDAVARFGQPTDSYELLNAKSFEFFGGKLVLTFMHDTPGVIAKIRVLSTMSESSLQAISTDIKQAKSLFGMLKLTKHDNLHGLIFERPGLRIACDTSPEPEPVNWIEFYKPGT